MEVLGSEEWSSTGDLVELNNNNNRGEWISTGDLVEFSRGSHKLWGRLDMSRIIHKGATINTVQVQNKLLSHKDIDDCYVVGLGDVKVGVCRLSADYSQAGSITVQTLTSMLSCRKISNWLR